MSKGRRNTLLAAGVLLLGAPLLTAPGAAADDRDDEQKFEVELEAVPHPAVRVQADGEAELELSGTKVDVELEAEGVAANLPHLVHIHGLLDAVNECPTAAHDLDGNGLISIVEGAGTAPDGSLGYGPVQVSFTRSGDVSAASGGAFDRMPVADDDGEIEYERTFTLPAPVTGETPRELARSLGDMHIVVHGVDLNGNGTYDPENPDLGDPTDAEALLPALCGTIDRDD